MIKALLEGYARYQYGHRVTGVLLIMDDGAIWFHPYSGAKPERCY